MVEIHAIADIADRLLLIREVPEGHVGDFVAIQLIGGERFLQRRGGDDAHLQGIAVPAAEGVDGGVVMIDQRRGIREARGDQQSLRVVR